MTVVGDVIEIAATRLQQAADTGTPCSPVRDVLGDNDIGLAYRVQSRLTVRRVALGAQVVGRKIGLTSPAVQEQLGVSQPDFGVLFADMWCSSDGGDVVLSGALGPMIPVSAGSEIVAAISALGQVSATFS